MLVDEDPVADRRGRPRRRAACGLHADADDHEVALDIAPVARPDALDGPVALERLDAGPQQHPHAVVGVDVAVDGPHLAPSTRSSGTAIGSTTVTSSPRCLADAATSAPIQPAPTTTTAPPRSSRSRSASESPTLRR